MPRCMQASFRTASRTGAIVLAASSIAAPALAYEDQVGLTATLGYSGIIGDTTLPPHAIAAGVGVSFGLGDTWELRARGDYSFHVASAHRGALTADLVYLIDVLSVVPYLGLSIGGAITGIDATAIAPSELRGDLLLGAVVGVDVLLGREWTIGVEIRPHVMVLHMNSEPFDLAALVRVQRLIEM